MKKYISLFLFVFILLAFGSAHAVDSKNNCISGDGKTVDEAFKAGVKLAKEAGLKLGGEEGSARIHILPKNEHGLHVVNVCSSSLGLRKAGK